MSISVMWSFYPSRLRSVSRETLDSNEESKTGLISRTPSARNEIATFRVHSNFALLHILIATLWLSTFWTFTPLYHKDVDVLKPLEFEPIAEAIEYEEVVFKISGGGTRKDPVTPYEGPPTPEKDMRWYEQMNVGMIALTPEMNKTLKFPTQPKSKIDSTPIIQLDVFHQLHCLNAIRNIVYGTNIWYNSDDRQDQIHIDHCIDYLRQVIMCHSDVTPITHAPRPEGFNPLLSDWRPKFAVHYTCRNFQKIHDWAAKYNTSGYAIESWPGLDPVAELRAKPKDEGQTMES
ncbi:hypothetical protein B0O99DRAFT_675382 [Bisporella sp. PMI_857]|nr:hypothetical protein B0O99DRAFT_675382 [Bisporella sp. PMI_857]